MIMIMHTFISMFHVTTFMNDDSKIGYGLAGNSEESVLEGLAYLHHRFNLP